MSETNLIFDTVELNGTFNSWCGNCAQMNDDNNDSVWEITIPLMTGNYEYKFSADNWNIQEDLFEFDDCVVGSPPYINRDLIVSGNGPTKGPSDRHAILLSCQQLKHRKNFECCPLSLLIVR